MAWVSVHQSVLGHKLRGFRKRVSCSECEALGILVKVWLWGLDNADKEGKLINTNKDDLAELLARSISLKLKPSYVADLLIEEEWVDEVNGDLFIHDWKEWQSFWYEFQERRDKDRARKQKQNGKSTENPNEYPQKIHGNSVENKAEYLRNNKGNSKDIPVYTITEPNQTEPNQTKTEQGTNTTTAFADAGVAGAAHAEQVPYKQIAERYNTICTKLRKIRSIDGERKKAVAARFKKYGMDAFITLFEKANASNFLCGGGSKNWSADFDWLMNATNIAKVLEGKYDDRDCQTPGDSPHGYGGNIFFDYAHELNANKEVLMHD